jgi:hypothetical protein
VGALPPTTQRIAGSRHNRSASFTSHSRPADRIPTAAATHAATRSASVGVTPRRGYDLVRLFLGIAGAARPADSRFPVPAGLIAAAESDAPIAESGFLRLGVLVAPGIKRAGADVAIDDAERGGAPRRAASLSKGVRLRR